jgi:polyisoprenoid-binding protein YceI
MIIQSLNRCGFASAVFCGLFVGHSVPQHPHRDSRPVNLDGAYTTDVTHTSVAFEVGHLGLSSTTGFFTRHEGHIVVNREDLKASSVEFKIDASSIDTGFDRRDVNLRSVNFFDVVTHPLITFSCHRVRKAGAKYVADGLFSMMGHTHPLSILFKLKGPMRDGEGDIRIGLIADPVVIKRSDYGLMGFLTMPDGSPGVSDEVTIHLAVEATKDRPGV